MKKMLAHSQALVPSARQWRPDVPVEVEKILRRLLAKRPEDRLATGGELASCLAPFAMAADLRGLKQPDGTVPVTQQSTPSCSASSVRNDPDVTKVNWKMVGCVAAGILMGCMIIVAFWSFNPLAGIGAFWAGPGGSHPNAKGNRSSVPGKGLGSTR